MIRVIPARLLSLAILGALAACSSGGGDDASVRTGGDFVVLKTEPSDNATLFLNDPIRIDFSNKIDLNSVNLSTFSFQVLDQVGNTVAEPVAGSFELATSPGDVEPGRRLQFVPRLPTNDTYTDGGFRPGRTYVVQLVGGSVVNNTMLRDQSGRGLALPRTFRFSTADGSSPGQLFRNTASGGPRRVGMQVTPTPDANGVVLNKLGAPPVEIRLQFDQPLNPISTNVPVALDINPLTRNSNNRGRISLEYDDPDVTLGVNTWIPADIDLETNTATGSSVVIRPLGVLPNNATIRVIVERTLEDISGESNFSNPTYVKEFGNFRTKRAYEQQFDALVEDFLASDNIDLTAAFAEPYAEVGPGYIKAGFGFEGSPTGADFEPVPPETVLNTDFTQITPVDGAPFNVSGGIFNFRRVKIPAGKIVRGTGSKPMVWLVSERFEVAGTLSVRGGNATPVNTANNANVPKPGGSGVCGGGDGGAGSPSATQRDLFGGTGNGPNQLVGGGGRGGALPCLFGCTRGAGGGGGSFATQGDPWFKIDPTPAGGGNPNVIFPQPTGIGGSGCTGASGSATRALTGASPGPVVFTDARSDNNFWGVGVRFDGSPVRIVGELALPIGGSGGGGGGDQSDANNCSTTDPTFANDASGGGGGGGGGALVVKCLGPIIVSQGGHITADGGNGGGGAVNGSSSRGGGGGGGSGGMVILISATRIEINARGTGTGPNTRYLYGAATGTDTSDFNFSISADGGVCTTNNFAAPQTSIITGKYMPNPTSIPATFANTYDTAPLGGFGGMGVVQLMVPPGDNSDGTNTRLDDNIVFIRGGVPATGAQKQALLGWRGYPNALGQSVGDDPNTPFNLGKNEGDIRPSPFLLPSPASPRSRLRSKWIDTGATARRLLTGGEDNLPRGIFDPSITVSGTDYGPVYEFAGYKLDNNGVSTGYTDYELAGSVAKPKFGTVVPASPILVTNATATYLGRPAYRVELTTPALGNLVDRFIGYQAELLSATGQALGGFRILAHTSRELFLAPGDAALPAGATQLSVRAKFFEVVTNGVEGLVQTYAGASGRVPVANVKIGFAFHSNPASPTAARYPATAGTFAYDLNDPAVQEAIRAIHADFVQWDVTFDLAYESVPADEPLPLRPDTPRPELRFLRLPFRF